MKLELRDYLKEVLVTNPDLASTEFGDRLDLFLNAVKTAENCKELAELSSQLLRTRSKGSFISAAEKGTFAAKLVKLLPAYASESFSAGKFSERNLRLAGLRDLLPKPGLSELLEIYFSKGYIWDHEYSSGFNALMDVGRENDLKLWVKAAKPLQPLPGEDGKTLAGKLIQASSPNTSSLMVFGAPENWPEDVKTVTAACLPSVYTTTIKAMVPTNEDLQHIIDVCLPYAPPETRVALAKVAFLNGDLDTARKADVKFTIADHDIARLSAGEWGDAATRFVKLIDFISDQMPDLPLNTDAGEKLLSKAINVGYDPTLKLLNMGVHFTDEWGDTYSLILKSEAMDLAQKETLVNLLIEKEVPLCKYGSHVVAATSYQGLKGANADFTDKLLKLALGDNFKDGYSKLFFTAVKNGHDDFIARAKDIVGPDAFFNLGNNASAELLPTCVQKFPEMAALILAGAAYRELSSPSQLTGTERIEFWDKAAANVLKLKEQGADLSQAILLGHDILHRASSAPKKQFVRIIKNGGFTPAAINTPNSAGATIMHTVAANGEVQSLQLLINLGGDVEQKNAKGQSVLFEACLGQHSATINYLDKVGASFKTCDAAGNGLFTAVLKNERDTEPVLLQLLIAKQASIASDKPILQLLASSFRYSPEMLKGMLELGANPNAVIDNSDPVVFCGQLSHEPYLDQMVSFGLDVFSYSSSGASVLSTLELDAAKKLIQLALARAKSKLELNTAKEFPTVESDIELG